MNIFHHFQDFSPPSSDADRHNSAEIIQINPFSSNPFVLWVIRIAHIVNTVNTSSILSSR